MQDSIQIYHIEEVAECKRGCGTPVVQLEVIHEDTGLMRVTCEAIANIATGEIHLKVHTECPKKENYDETEANET